MKDNQLVKLNQINENIRELKGLLLKLGANKVAEQIEDSFHCFVTEKLLLVLWGLQSGVNRH